MQHDDGHAQNPLLPVDWRALQPAWEKLSDGLVILDAAGTIRDANGEAHRLLAAAGDPLIGTRFAHAAEPGWSGVLELAGPETPRRVQAAVVAAGGVRVVILREAGQDRLREQVSHLNDILESISDGFFSLDDDWKITYFNRAAEQILGLRRDEVLGRHLLEVFPDARGSIFEERYAAVMRERQPLEFEAYYGQPRFANWYEVKVYPRVNGMSVYFRVTTSRRQAEEEHRKFEARLQQAQKLESLGVLAGGIAHDFNNLLMGILGHADLALMELSPVAPARGNLEQIIAAARSAADLTRQMLAYSGKGSYVLQHVHLSLLVEEMAHLLQVSVSKKCVLKYKLDPNLPLIQGDPAQLRQVVMNLVVNASEAIADQSGVISVSTGAMHCDRAYLKEAYLDDERPEGRYVFIEVADNGAGMAPEVRARIFEPFYSTKFTGRGMGLAAVLGIVRSLSGAIKVYSEPGQGTTFKVLVPAVEAVETAVAAAPASAEWRGHGTVLVADDEQAVCKVAAQMLERLGFKVLLARDGREAVEVFRKNVQSIVVVLLDMTMPHLSGEEAYREMRRIQSDVRVVLSSGYSEEDATQHWAGKGLAGFIQKPYRSAELARVLRAALGDMVG